MNTNRKSYGLYFCDIEYDLGANCQGQMTFCTSSSGHMKTLQIKYIVTFEHCWESICGLYFSKLEFVYECNFQGQITIFTISTDPALETSANSVDCHF